MVYRGHIQKGVVVFDAPANLADGTEVTVEAVTEVSAKIESREGTEPEALSTNVAPGNEWLLRFAGAATDLPSDAARNLDHYLYGHAKRQ